MNRNIILIGAGVVILIFVGLFFLKKSPAPTPATLEFWGYQDEIAFREIIPKFQQEYKHLTVKYRGITPSSYEDTLVNSLAEGKGPDVFMIPSSWIQKHKDKFAPLPSNFRVTAKDIKKVYIDMADDVISPEGEILGLPLSVDTIALLYNKDKFNSAGFALPPKTWDDIIDYSKKLTLLNEARDIIKSGLSIGTGKNTAYAFEILTGMFFQDGESIFDKETSRTNLNRGEALDLYTSFADKKRPNFSWSDRQKDSLTSLADGTSAMAFGYAKDLPRIGIKNQHLSLGVSDFPQPKGISVPVVFGTMEILAVARTSKNNIPAWQLIMYLAGKEPNKEYAKTLNLIPARRDLISEGTDSDKMDVFYRQALIAKDWPIPDEKKAKKLFEDVIAAVNNKTLTVEEALQTLRQQLELIIP